MRIAFFGTPEFALPSLTALQNPPHQVVGVVTAPAKPQGRGLNPQSTPVAETAAKLGLPILQPVELRDPEFLQQLQAWRADLFAVVAFRILPVEVFTLPKYGSVNLHASLLPKYRGAAPIQWALWHGETVTGVTTFQLERTVDTGNILKQRQVQILDEDDAGSLAEKLAKIGAQVLLETVSEIEAGNATLSLQNAALATPAPKITKEHCQIDWRRTAVQIRNQIRALSPEPGAYTILNQATLKIFRAEISAVELALNPGEIWIDDHNIIAGTGQGNLRILEVQLQGKNRLNSESLLRGFRLRGRFTTESHNAI